MVTNVAMIYEPWLI